MSSRMIHAEVWQGPNLLPRPQPGEAPFTTRFAPSPTGYLHLGHAFAARIAHDAARRSGGRFLLRFEDLDPGRCRPEFVEGILADLAWLNLRFDGAARRQSANTKLYQTQIDDLDRMGVVYPCFCTRKQVLTEIAKAGQAPHGTDGQVIYPGTCRDLPRKMQDDRIKRGDLFSVRLDVARATALTGPLTWHDLGYGEVQAEPTLFGDIVLARKDAPASYHLAVTVDDARQGITLVTRGSDLFAATHVHRLLQALLGLPTPRYYHHGLIFDERGERLAKRNRAATLRHWREHKRTPEQLWASLNPPIFAEPSPGCCLS